ncbi:GNAT family N-acetyltransferase [Maribellus comscasis]|uniref:GNAT family N-acetyltransferase n=1 Tax=Maribellus comscasis TaxID=2681766 RepID=A0A6I6JRV2_9BACT|nr:GNAT family N-acetyltransferase [Maribellus comscasis]QGY45775.1 GNAT family N-acetyltransferase [Maribellus comscasis]
MNLKVLFNPTQQHFEEIKKWLQEEDNSSNEGFFCQIDTIENSYRKNRLIVIVKDDVAIGFLSYYYYNRIVNIEIAEVKPNERKKGYCKKLLQLSFSWFVKKGALVAQLFCAPASSEKIWKRMGFINFPDEIIKEPRIYLYRILVGIADFYTYKNEIELIELWDIEDYQNEVPPKWRWEIKRQEKLNKLINPIIHPCSDEWSVAHKIGSEIREKRIMKYFDMKKHDGGYFLIVTELER